MSPALRDLLEQLSIDSDKLSPAVERMLDDAVNLATVQGVKIGGIYKHWKGKEYVVKSVSRDADDWNVFLVTYVEVTDARHEASRRISYFLGDMNDDRHVGPRFRLVG